MTPCSLIDCMALVNVIHIESSQSSRCHNSRHHSLFSVPCSPDRSCNAPAIRCYDYTLSGGAEEVAAHSRRSPAFAMKSVDPENKWDNHFVRHFVRNAAWENKLWYCFGQLSYVTLGSTLCAECVCIHLFHNIFCTLQIVVTVRRRICHCGTQAYQHVGLQLRLLILMTSKFRIWNMTLVRIMFWN